MKKVTARYRSDPVDAYQFAGDDLHEVEWLLDELTAHGGEPTRPMLGITSVDGEPRLFLRTSGVYPKLLQPGMWALIHSGASRWDALSDEDFRQRYEVLE